MSTDLRWRPATPIPDVEHLGYALKRALAKRLWGHDGSLHGSETLVDQTFIPYLEGLLDAGLEDAEELINAINKHKQVIIWIS